MISYSFSPNWYRAQCLSFSQKKRIFYYSSNCIVYKYDLERKRILSQVNIKDWLMKNEGYNLGRMNAQKQQVGGERQSQLVKGSNREKQHGERVLKINCIELVQSGLGEDILIVGLNWMGLVLILSSSNTNSNLKVQSTIDLHKKTTSQIQAVQYINVYQKHIKSSKETKKQQSKDKNTIFDIVIFSPQGIVVKVKLLIGEGYKENERGGRQLGRVEVVVDSWNRLVDSQVKKGRYLQVKAIAREQIQISNTLINQNNSCLLQDSNQQSTKVNVVFLSHTVQVQIDSTLRSGNIILYDSNFDQILSLTSVEQMRQNLRLKDKGLQQKEMPSNILSNETVLSVDFLKGKDSITYIVLAKPNHKNKPKPFCQTFHLHTFSSHQLLSSLNKQPNPYSIMISTKIQIIYPKKCHHKLSQQQKSTLCIKLINSKYAVITGRLGEMIILSLKQIQIQSNNNPSFTISIRPYSYQEEANNIYRIQHSQRHYKDIYAIYRVGEQEYYNNSYVQHKTSPKMYFIGTDHILTQWQHSTNPQLQIHNQKLLRYESSLKFLTSSVDQIVLSQLEPSLVFLRLRDSNIRSFQPYTDRSYWLNQFWKHTNVSFCKKVQKLVMHPKDIGVACLVNDEGKLILYDLYQERLIRLIEVNKKVIKKNEVISSSLKCNENDNKFKKQHNKKLQGNKQQQQRQKCIQINSISFQHISIIQCFQSLYQLHNDCNQQGAHSLKGQFEVKSQQFYDKLLDKETVIMIQSNEFILILVEGVNQGRYMGIEVYKKVFKLERIYKTKYWDGSLMLGRRKRKGQLMVNVGMRYVEQHNRQSSKQQKSQLHKGLIVKSLQNEIDLPLGVSSRYIFKLVNGNGNNKREYFLIVINYKGNKLCVVIYSIQLLGQLQPIQLTKLLVSEQTSIPNLNLSSSSTQSHQTAINIQHLIISQQQNQFLIAVYNNPTQTITIVDYTLILTTATALKETLTCQKLSPQIKLQQQTTEKQNENIQKQNENIYKQNQNIEEQNETIEKQNAQLFSCKRSLNKFLVKDNNPNEKDIYQQYKSKDKQSISNLKTSQALKIEICQFSGLSYKIENMMFNSVFSQGEMSQIGHLIILGKDQSVRLLNLNNHMSSQGLMGTSKSMQHEEAYGYRVHKRCILMKFKVDRYGIEG